jgi:hypothetical protein
MASPWSDPRPGRPSVAAAEAVDVAVVGGGSAGVAAALAAARAGARCALLERGERLGGNVAEALVHTVCGLYELASGSEPVFVQGGIARELAEALGGAPERAGRAWYLPMRPAAWSALLRARCETEAPRLSLRLGASCEGAQLAASERSESLLRVRERGALRELSARVVIDASGDAAVVAQAGAAFELAPPSELQCASYVFRLAGVAAGALSGFARVQCSAAIAGAARHGALPLGADSVVLRECSGDVYATLNLPRPPRWDPLDDACVAEETARAHAAARAVATFLCETRPGFAASALAEHPRRIGLRETRRGVGREVVTEADVLAGRRRDDEVALSSWPVELWRDHRRATFAWPERASGVPLGALIARDHPRLGLAGRCLSATHEAHGALRVIGTALATGDAIGRAAAFAADADCALAAIAPDRVASHTRAR